MRSIGGHMCLLSLLYSGCFLNTEINQHFFFFKLCYNRLEDLTPKWFELNGRYPQINIHKLMTIFKMWGAFHEYSVIMYLITFTAITMFDLFCLSQRSNGISSSNPERKLHFLPSHQKTECVHSAIQVLSQVRN